MPDREFIHAREDVQETLRHARTLGLRVLPDAPRANNTTEPLNDAAIESSDRGVFQLFRPEWVADSLQVMRIEAGHNAGKYVVRPSVNFAPITLYFQGESDHAGQRRLGSGTISFKREWLHERTNEMRPSPLEVARTYDALCKHLLSRESVKAGVHRYFLCRHAARVAVSEMTVPPFDFIPWPPSPPKGRSTS